MQFYIKEYGDALVSFLQTNAITLGITGLIAGNIDWARAINNEPVYILDPNTSLPNIKIRFNNMNSKIGPQARTENMYEYSLFYYRKQTIGAEHQQLLVADLEKISGLFLIGSTNVFRLPAFSSIGGANAQLLWLMVSDIVMYPELKYKIDSPSIRISCAEMKILINSWSFNN